MVKFLLIAESSNGKAHHFLLIKMISEILFFFIGCLVGWLTNHWYSVNMSQPYLKHNGSGSGANFNGSGYRYITFSVHNELRRLGFSLPETVILGKALRTSFGNQIIERDPARQCRARLLEPSGTHITHLWWWLTDSKAANVVEIKSGESAHLILFLRSDSNPNQYFTYQPTSSTDQTPQTSGIPKFDKPMSFLLEVSYSHGSQRLRLPVKVNIGYDGRFSYETPNSSGGF